MKKQSGFSVLLLGCFIILVFSCKKETDPEYDLLNNQIIQQWEVVTDSMLANTKIPGIIIGIWAPDRNLAWVVGKGKANTATGPFMTCLMGNPLKKWTNTEIIDLVRTEPFYFSPGTSFEYSNTNTIIAGKIVEQLSG